MAKTQKTATSKKAVQSPPTIIVNEITVGQLNRGNQTIKKWMENLKAAEREIRPNRRYLLDTYHDISIDLHLDSVKGKRIRALKNIPFQWPTLEEGRIKENLSSPWFLEMLQEFGEAIFQGYHLLEFPPGEDGLIGSCAPIPPQNVYPDLKVITPYMFGDPSTGWKYAEGFFTSYILEIGKPKNLGLFSKLAPYVMLKRDNLGDFARFNELFGMPLRVYEYDPLDATARTQVTKAAEEQGSAAYIVVPKGTAINIHDANQSGSSQAYSIFHKVLNDEITIGVLGQTLTTSNDGVGSNALGNVHMQVEEDLAMEDRVQVEMTINYPFRKNILIPRGYGLENVKGSFILTEEISMENKLQMWLDMVDRGVHIAEEDFYEEFGVPFPDGRPVVVPPAQPPVDPNKKEEDPNNPQPGGAGKKKQLSGTALAVAELYASTCKHRYKARTLSLSFQDDLSESVNRIIQQLFNRELSAGDVDPELWELIGNELLSGVEKGLTGNLTGSKGIQAGMRTALKEDVFVFSGFKNYQFLKQASELLTDEHGNVRAFGEFRDEVLKLSNEYNVNFLQAEYNHAIASSRMAGKWSGFIENQDTLPLLEYLTAGDSRVRASHAKLNNIILPVDHPFWDEYMPPNDWNCRCNVRQLAAGKQTVIKDDQLPTIKDDFKFNPGKQKVIFPKSHPYYNVADKDRGKADNNFGLKIPK